MLGDDPLYPHKDSLFAYAHLGSEVKMRPGSGKSIIVDNYCSPNDTKARVVSGTTEEDFYSDDETVDGVSIVLACLVTWPTMSTTLTNIFSV
jgi:hypothetical protein